MQAASLLVPWRPGGSEMWTDAPSEAGQQPQTLPLSTQIYTLGRLLGLAWKKCSYFNLECSKQGQESHSQEIHCKASTPKRALFPTNQVSSEAPTRQAALWSAGSSPWRICCISACGGGKGWTILQEVGMSRKWAGQVHS